MSRNSFFGLLVLFLSGIIFFSVCGIAGAEGQRYTVLLTNGDKETNHVSIFSVTENRYIYKNKRLVTYDEAVHGNTQKSFRDSRPSRWVGGTPYSLRLSLTEGVYIVYMKRAGAEKWKKSPELYVNEKTANKYPGMVIEWCIVPDDK